MNTVELWMRLGVTIKATPEQAREILKGNNKVLKSSLNHEGKQDFFDQSKAWYFDGDSYIPDEVAGELCQLLDLDPKERGLDYNL